MLAGCFKIISEPAGNSAFHILYKNLSRGIEGKVTEALMDKNQASDWAKLALRANTVQLGTSGVSTAELQLLPFNHSFVENPKQNQPHFSFY